MLLAKQGFASGVPHACERAYAEVLGQCSPCADCSFEEVDCTEPAHSADQSRSVAPAAAPALSPAGQQQQQQQLPHAADDVLTVPQQAPPSPAAIGQTVSALPLQEPLPWSNPSGALRQPAPPSRFTASSGTDCGTACLRQGAATSCQDSLLWAAGNLFKGQANACNSALTALLQECPACSQCSLDSLACSAVQATNMPTARPTTIIITTTITTTTRWHLPFDCDEGWPKWEHWCAYKKAWCCSARGRACPQSTTTSHTTSTTTMTSSTITTSSTSTTSSSSTASIPRVEAAEQLAKWMDRGLGKVVEKSALEAQDCSGAEAKASWSPARRTWCCQHQDIGCASESLGEKFQEDEMRLTSGRHFRGTQPLASSMMVLRIFAIAGITVMALFLVLHWNCRSRSRAGLSTMSFSRNVEVSRPSGEEARAADSSGPRRYSALAAQESSDFLQ